jgi:glycosyltransferase involved in cell wall biosynthesis
MKILLVNKYFFPRGGSEASFFEEAALLEKRGHEVVHFAMAHPRNNYSPYSSYFVSRVEFEDSTSWLQKARAGSRMLYSWQARQRLAALVRAEKPDLAHLHNIYHHISPSILPVLKKAKVPVVLTFHDYKFLCPVYTLYRRGKTCEECRTGRFVHCLQHKCSKNSYLKSALNTLEMYLHHSVLNIYDLVDCFICPSRHLKNMMAGRIEDGKRFLLPNFITEISPFSPLPAGGKTIVYFGRLSREKGLPTLLKAIKGLDVRCLIIGEGPERAALKKIIKEEGLDRVACLGYLQPKDLQAYIRQAAFTVLPSEWYENSPRAVLESFALGRAVVASRIGGLSELVIDNETGLTFEAGNALDLREKILQLFHDSQKAEEMGRRARRFVQEQLGPEGHYESLMKIYETARTSAGLPRLRS